MFREAVATSSSAPRIPAAHAESVTGAQIRPPLRSRRDDRLGRSQDVQEPRGIWSRVQTAGSAGWSRRRSAWGLLSGHYRGRPVWSDAVLDEAQQRLQRWREATALPAGPAADDVIGRLRGYPADDLDTPKALAAVDGWATDALTLRRT